MRVFFFFWGLHSLNNLLGIAQWVEPKQGVGGARAEVGGGNPGLTLNYGWAGTGLKTQPFMDAKTERISKKDTIEKKRKTVTMHSVSQHAHSRTKHNSTE